jgi:hypothetical protein
MTSWWKPAVHPSINSITKFGEIVDSLTAFVSAAAAVILQTNTEMVISASTVASKLATATAQENAKRAQMTREGSPDVTQERETTPLQLLHATVISRAVQATKMLYELTLQIPRIAAARQSSTDLDEEWKGFWLPVLSALSQQSYHPCREIRQNALTYLQRALMAQDVGVNEGSDHQRRTIYLNIFTAILFPLLETLLTPDMSNLDYYSPVGKHHQNKTTMMQTTMIRTSAPTSATAPQFNRGMTIDEIRIQVRITEYFNFF